MNKAKLYGFLISVIGVMVGLITLLLHVKVVTVSNYFFFVGLLFFLVGTIAVLSKGHLFTGWRIFHRKGDKERFENEKIPADEIGGIKNAKIMIRPTAQLTLIIGIIWIAFAIVITL